MNFKNLNFTFDFVVTIAQFFFNYSSITTIVSLNLRLTENTETFCFLELGCFPTGYPWSSIRRPFPEPWPPYDINTNLLLYTRRNNNVPRNIKLWPVISIENTTYQTGLSYNVFLIHGYLSNGKLQILRRVVNAYLNRRNANVFVVDWADGAKTLNYLQAASNARIVGAELARFARFLQKRYSIPPSTFHVMGHSLGAQVASYFGKRFSGIGRLTALDPARPGFENCDERVRLTKTDASFVETLHTNIRPFVLAGGGMIEPISHVDIYANGGLIQPGCPFVELFSNRTFLTAEGLASTFGCSHVRAVTYTIEALENDNCTFWAHPIKNVNRTTMGMAVTLTLNQLFSNVSKCTVRTCTPFSLEKVNYSARGVYVLQTNPNPPFCINEM